MRILDAFSRDNRWICIRSRRASKFSNWQVGSIGRMEINSRIIWSSIINYVNNFVNNTNSKKILPETLSKENNFLNHKATFSQFHGHLCENIFLLIYRRNSFQFCERRTLEKFDWKLYQKNFRFSSYLQVRIYILFIRYLSCLSFEYIVLM